MPYHQYANRSTAYQQEHAKYKQKWGWMKNIKKYCIPPDPRRGAGDRLMGKNSWNNAAVTTYTENALSAFDVQNPGSNIFQEFTSLPAKQASVIINTVQEMVNGPDSTVWKNSTNNSITVDDYIATLVQEDSGNLSVTAGTSNQDLNALFGSIIYQMRYQNHSHEYATQAWVFWNQMTDIQKTTFAQAYMSQHAAGGKAGTSFQKTYDISNICSELAKIVTGHKWHPNHHNAGHHTHYHPTPTPPLPFNPLSIVIPLAVMVGVIIYYNNK